MRQSERSIAARMLSRTSDQRSHGRAMAVVVGTLVTAVRRREVLSRENLAVQFRNLGHAGVDDRNGYALARADLPYVISLHGVEMPLLRSNGLRMGRGRGDPGQQETHQGRGRLAHAHPVHCPFCSVDHRRDNTTAALPGLFVFSQVVGAFAPWSFRRLPGVCCVPAPAWPMEPMPAPLAPLRTRPEPPWVNV